MDGEECVGAIVCKLDRYKDSMRGYIAMLAVDAKCRRKKIGSNLVTLAIKRMIQNDADEVTVFLCQVKNENLMQNQFGVN